MYYLFTLPYAYYMLIIDGFEYGELTFANDLFYPLRFQYHNIAIFNPRIHILPIDRCHRAASPRP
ncbi:MAG: hypothetical protein INR73_07510 [Williamsia sp.]|nr:hypothetical protein [Williamsia sp.]